MEAIAELDRGYFRWKFGINADHKPCFAWADERLLLDHEGADFDIVFLAGVDSCEEALRVTDGMLTRYSDPAVLDEELAAESRSHRLWSLYAPIHSG